eukprot:354579-Chlamydomonas_euryale.AAC.3
MADRRAAACSERGSPVCRQSCGLLCHKGRLGPFCNRHWLAFHAGSQTDQRDTVLGALADPSIRLSSWHISGATAHRSSTIQRQHFSSVLYAPCADLALTVR